MARELPKYELLSEEKTKEMLKMFEGEKTGWVLVGPEKWFFPHKYIEQSAGYFNTFKVRPDDKWVVTFPRSGTTWMQELVWLLSNDLDFETAKKQHLAERFPFFEFSMLHHPMVTREFLEMNKGDAAKQELCKKIARPGYEVVASMPSPRFIKSHFPLSLLKILDVGCKVVYVARNPKDVAVSWYYLNTSFKTQGFKGDFESFWNYFENDYTTWSPFFTHVKEAWELKDKYPNNLLFIFYEEMQRDFPKAIKKVAKFLGKTYTDEQVEKVAEYLHIKNVKNNPMINGEELKDAGVIVKTGNFVRKGGSGGWKDIFSAELNDRADKWIEANLKDTDLRFSFLNNNE